MDFGPSRLTASIVLAVTALPGVQRVASVVVCLPKMRIVREQRTLDLHVLVQHRARIRRDQSRVILPPRRVTGARKPEIGRGRPIVGGKPDTGTVAIDFNIDEWPPD